MSDLKIYGVPLSRAYRAWMANELGLDYEMSPSISPTAVPRHRNVRGATRTAGSPAIDDDGPGCGKSMAINLYLAKKHGSDLLPKQWRTRRRRSNGTSAMTRWRNRRWRVAHRFFLPEDQRDSKLADEGEQQLLGDHRWRCSINRCRQRLLSRLTFTVADLNVALGAVIGPDGQGELGRLPGTWTNGWPDAEAAGRGEGETADDGELTWAVDRGPSPASASGFRTAPWRPRSDQLQGVRNGRSSSRSLIEAPDRISARPPARRSFYLDSQMMLQRVSSRMMRWAVPAPNNESRVG